MLINWQNLFHIAEIPDVTALPRERSAGIHYAVRGVRDWPRLILEITQVLETGWNLNRAPCGLRVGRLTAGLVTDSFDYCERDVLLHAGINPIIIRDVPYVFGQLFVTGVASRPVALIADEHGITSAFHTLLQRQDAPVQLTPAQTALHRAILVHSRPVGLLTGRS